MNNLWEIVLTTLIIVLVFQYPIRWFFPTLHTWVLASTWLNGGISMLVALTVLGSWPEVPILFWIVLVVVMLSSYSDIRREVISARNSIKLKKVLRKYRDAVKTNPYDLNMQPTDYEQHFTDASRLFQEETLKVFMGDDKK